MKVNFFEKELTRIWERFNQTFGKQIVCDLQVRAQVIIAIIHLGMLGNKIMKAKDKEMVRGDIRMFIRIKNTLTTIFNNAEKIWQERRRYDKGTQRDRRANKRFHIG
jgi:formamidopyrimidine-DNA glycosylase